MRRYALIGYVRCLMHRWKHITTRALISRRDQRVNSFVSKFEETPNNEMNKESGIIRKKQAPRGSSWKNGEKNVEQSSLKTRRLRARETRV